MKTFPVTSKIGSLMLLVLFILTTTESFSQQVITFKDGTSVEVFITYQTKDTVKYYLQSQPQVVYIETMNNILHIQAEKPPADFKADSLKNILLIDKTYLRYKKITNTGIVLSATGVVVGGLGIALLASSYENNDDLDQAFGAFFSMLVIGIGGGIFLTGIVFTVAGSAKMATLKKNLHGFSFDLKCTPQVKGVSVVYRF
jgi:hypothetical protein